MPALDSHNLTVTLATMVPAAAPNELTGRPAVVHFLPNVIVTRSLDTSALQLALLNAIVTGDASVDAPLRRYTGPLALSVASAAVLMTFAVVCAARSAAITASLW